MANDEGSFIEDLRLREAQYANALEIMAVFGVENKLVQMQYGIWGAPQTQYVNDTMPSVGKKYQ